MEYFNSTIREDSLERDHTIPYADDDFSNSYTNGINNNVTDDLDNAKTKVNSHEDIDIEALLSRPRCYRRLFRNTPLESAPEFAKRLDPFFEVPAGVAVVFECRVCAFPNPTVKWYMDDEEVTEAHARYHIEADESRGIHQLIIERAGKADEGAFKCKAENREGVASTTGYLSVTGEEKHRPQGTHRRLHREQAVSSPPPLCTIVEQKSVEESEAKAQAAQGPSPIQDYINNIRKGTSWTLINMMHLYHSFTSSKDDEEVDDQSSTDSQADVIDSSEPSTPTAECDGCPVPQESAPAVVSWTELAQSLSKQTEKETESETGRVSDEKECKSGSFEDRNDDNVNKATRTKGTNDTVMASADDVISKATFESLQCGQTPATDLTSMKNGEVRYEDNYKLDSITTVNSTTTSPPKVAKKRMIKITKERRKKLKKQTSLVELTVQWFIVKVTSVFGEQLDKPRLYYIAFTILGACFAVAVELSPIYMVLTFAFLSFLSFYFMKRFHEVNNL